MTDDTTDTEEERLVSSLAAVRRELKEAETRLKAFGDATPDMIGRFKLDDTASPTAKQIAEHVHAATDARVSIATRELNKKLAEQQATIDRLTKESTDHKAALDSAKLESSVRQAARLGGVVDSAHDDLLVMAKAAGFKVDSDGLLKNPDGLDINSWLDGKKETSPHLWPRSHGAGARGDSHHKGLPHDDSRNPFAKGEHFSLTAQSQIFRTDPARATRLQKLANG